MCEREGEGRTQAGDIVVEDGKEGSLPLKFYKAGADDADDGCTAEDGNVEPVEIFVPVVPGDGGKG